MTTSPEVIYPPAAATIGAHAPTFTADSVVNGEITTTSLADYAGKYVVVLFYPKDFTYVCPTEIIAFNDAKPEFDKIGAQVVAISTDTAESHLAWIRTPRDQGGLGNMEIPVVADVTKTIAAQYGVLIKDIGIALRGLFIIDPSGVLQQATINNLPVGRSVPETIRLIQAFQFVAEHGEVCPADWHPGEATMKADPNASQEYFSAAWGSGETTTSSAQTTITSGVVLDELVKAHPKLVVTFSAPWCGKCRQIAPYVEQLAAQHPDITFAKIDTSEPASQNVGPEVGIHHLPGFLVYSGGKRVGEPITGYKKKELERVVKELAAM